MALTDAGPINGLVHVAGGLALDQWARTEELTLETFDAVIALNLRAALVTSQAVASRLIAQGDGGASVRPSFLDSDDLPVFVHDAELRRRLKP